MQMRSDFELSSRRQVSALLLVAAAGMVANGDAWSLPAPTPAPSTLYSFSLVKPGGGVMPLSTYKGKVVVIVNLASKSTFAEQNSALEKLEEQYKDKGLVVLGVPSNDFGAEEPGDDAAIQKFYTAQHVSFPVLAKSVVCGKDALPVFRFLTAPLHPVKPAPMDGSEPAGSSADAKNEVHWSYTKFIVTRDGLVGARFEPDVAPDSPAFQIAIDKALAGTLKPGAKPVKGGGGDDDDGDDDDGGL